MSRLANAQSAYLRSAAHQPVDWYPWGSEPFARAREEDKPILLDIGAVWCHWCHVMDGESYENEDLARLLNERWICIKVDRDERPDVDARYQRAVQAITGQGGWPLTAFLTPDGEVFYGGTYFPPDGKYGRPGFSAVLTELARAYHAEREKIVDQVATIRRHVWENGEEVRPGALPADLRERAADGMARTFDFRYGGFGGQPKFPHPVAIEFLLGRWMDTGVPWNREMVDRTLDAMARGGIYDQIGGGFHRYSVDARWIVPHFEKMVYDNAELLRVYVLAASSPHAPQTPPPDYALFRTVIEGTCDWILHVLSDPDGGYYASQDADVGLDDDGDYFTWTPDEVRAVVSADQFAVLARRYDIDEHGEMQHNPRKNVLWVKQSVQEIAAGLERPTAEIDELLRAGVDALRAARAQRTAPFVDTTLYVGWNGMMASAMLRAAAFLERDDVDLHALRTLERLHRDAADGRTGLRHAVGGAVPGVLDDYVQLANADIEVYEATGDRVWLERATVLMDAVWSRFRAPDGGLLDRESGDAEGLLAQPVRPIQDAPTPSPIGMASIVSARLGEHTGDTRWHDRRREILESVGASIADLGLHGATVLIGADWHLSPATHVVVVSADDAQSSALHRIARAAYRPRKVVTLLRPDAPTDGLPAPVRAMLDGTAPRAYVCVGTQCAPPCETPDELRSALHPA